MCFMMGSKASISFRSYGCTLLYCGVNSEVALKVAVSRVRLIDIVRTYPLRFRLKYPSPTVVQYLHHLLLLALTIPSVNYVRRHEDGRLVYFDGVRRRKDNLNPEGRLRKSYTRQRDKSEHHSLLLVPLGPVVIVEGAARVTRFDLWPSLHQEQGSLSKTIEEGSLGGAICGAGLSLPSRLWALFPTAPHNSQTGLLRNARLIGSVIFALAK